MAKLIRIDYETRDFTYRFQIGALSMAEGRDFLIKRMGRKPGFKITSISEIGEIDAITINGSKSVYFEGDEIKKEPVKEKVDLSDEPSIPDKPPSDENKTKNKIKCPWCGKFFKNQTGLNIHIKKMHK